MATRNRRVSHQDKWPGPAVRQPRACPGPHGDLSGRRPSTGAAAAHEMSQGRLDQVGPGSERCGNGISMSVYNKYAIKVSFLFLFVCI